MPKSNTIYSASIWIAKSNKNILFSWEIRIKEEEELLHFTENTVAIKSSYRQDQNQGDQISYSFKIKNVAALELILQILVIRIDLLEK